MFLIKSHLFSCVHANFWLSVKVSSFQLGRDVTKRCSSILCVSFSGCYTGYLQVSLIKNCYFSGVGKSGYSALAFANNGSLLACYSDAPDCKLTLW